MIQKLTFLSFTFQCFNIASKNLSGLTRFHMLFIFQPGLFLLCALKFPELPAMDISGRRDALFGDFILYLTNFVNQEMISLHNF